MVKRTFSLAKRVVRSGYVDPGSVRDLEIAADAAIAYSKLALTDSIVDADVAAAAAIAGSKISPDVSNAVIAIGSGQFIASGAQSVTGSGDIPTGIGYVYQAMVTLQAEPSLNGHLVSVLAGQPVGGSIQVKVWKPTGAADCTPIPATTPIQIYWLAIGELE